MAAILDEINRSAEETTKKDQHDWSGRIATSDGMVDTTARQQPFGRGLPLPRQSDLLISLPGVMIRLRGLPATGIRHVKLKAPLPR